MTFKLTIEQAKLLVLLDVELLEVFFELPDDILDFGADAHSDQLVHFVNLHLLRGKLLSMLCKLHTLAFNLVREQVQLVSQVVVLGLKCL